MDVLRGYFDTIEVSATTDDKQDALQKIKVLFKYILIEITKEKDIEQIYWNITDNQTQSGQSAVARGEIVRQSSMTADSSNPSSRRNSLVLSSPERSSSSSNSSPGKSPVRSTAVSSRGYPQVDFGEYFRDSSS